MIKIALGFGGEDFIKCNYIWLEPYARNTGRKFVFSGIQSGRNIVTHNDIISVDIAVSNVQDEWVFFIQFDILVLNYDKGNMADGKWWVYGNVCNIDEMQYMQGEIDSFNIWQKGEVFDWFNLPINSPLKLDYIGACMIYSGLSTKMNEKEIFYFDISLVKEERDFFYLASLEFVGDRGYFGHDFHTYKDCLLEIYNHSGYFFNKKISFINADKIHSPEILALIENVKSVFLEYKFCIL